MKRLARPLVLWLALLLPATPLLAATTVFRSTFRAQAASASFISVDASGCVETSVGVSAQDEATRVDGQSGVTSVVFIFISVFDSCTQTSLVSAAGRAFLGPDDLLFQKLDSATLNTPIEVDDFVSGTRFTVNVSLNWTGVGEQSRGKIHSHFTFPGFRVNSRVDATSRGATASGTMSDGTTNYTPTPDLAATLVMAKSGDLVVEKL